MQTDGIENIKDQKPSDYRLNTLISELEQTETQIQIKGPFG